MIKKLRMRFVFVNMLMLTLVLFATLSGIYILMVNSEVKMSEEIMDTLIDNHRKNIRDSDQHFSDPPVNSDSNTNRVLSADPVSYDLNCQASVVLLNDFRDDQNYSFEPYSDPGWESYWKDYFEHAPKPENPVYPPQWPVWPQWTQPVWENPEPPYSKPDHDKPVQTDTTTARPEVTTQPPAVTQESVIVSEHTEDTEPEIPQAAGEEITSTQPTSTTVPESSSVSSQPQSSASKSTSTGTQTAVPADKPIQETIPREPKHDISAKYNGNLIRSNIFVVLDIKKNITDISYQYFQNDTREELEAYDAQLKTAVKEIMKSSETKGKYEIESISYRYKITSTPDHKSYYVLLLDRSIEISTLKRLRYTFIIIGCIGIVAFFFISLAISAWAVKPTAIAWTKQKQFIADASHELKTPLTVISANTDVLLANPCDYIMNQERWIKYIKSETVRMTKLVNELLYIAKSDSNEIKMEKTEFDISNLISSVCLVFEPLVFESGRTLLSDITPHLKYFGDEDRIKQLITILLDNAVKYSIVHTEITASLFRNNQGRVKFCISNKCENIQKENLPKLFDRFYRLDDSRNSEKGGNGLGLNIAQTIAEAHSGSISVQYNYGIISFTVTF
ncbi:MAG: ATP-binding protein [Oscillospiraceae bacterium]|nr:ATP-binding protein [Oscillospiraceae bacterium]